MSASGWIQERWESDKTSKHCYWLERQFICKTGRCSTVLQRGGTLWNTWNTCPIPEQCGMVWNDVEQLCLDSALAVPWQPVTACHCLSALDTKLRQENEVLIVPRHSSTSSTVCTSTHFSLFYSFTDVTQLLYMSKGTTGRDRQSIIHL